MYNETAVVVVSYNNLALTQRCVDGLRNQTVPTTILVWDNASKDGTPQWLRNQKDIISVCSPKNILWTPAVNAGIENIYKHYKEAGASLPKYLGFMNNDIFLPTVSIERMTAELQDNSVGLVGPIVPRLGGPQDPYKCFPKRWEHLAAIKGDINEVLKHEPSRRCSFLLGAICMMRRNVFEEIGSLDNDMPLGADDHDYSIRLKDVGYELRVVTSVYADHAGHASAETEDGDKNWNEWGSKSWDAFEKKWAGYFNSEEEAVKCHWGQEYIEGWHRGTGWNGPRALTRNQYLANKGLL